MDYYKYLINKLGKVISENHCEYILYPFGERGAMAKGILNGIYGIQEKAIIDNKLCDLYETIDSLDYLKTIQENSYRILITSDRPEVWEELRERLYSTVKKEYCIELFPTPSFIEASQKDRARILKKMEEENILKENPVYHPRKTNSLFWLPLLPTDYIQCSILLADDYFERGILNKIFKLDEGRKIKEKIRKGTILDIGANIGNHTLFFCNECNAQKVYCFEPVDLTFSILKKNIELNHLEEKVVLSRTALGEREETGSAGYSVYNIGGSHVNRDENGNIQIKRLDSLTITEPVAFVKIDVEGMEAAVIKGGMELLRKNLPYIMVESFDREFPEVKELLYRIGYTYDRLDSSGNWLFSPL